MNHGLPATASRMTSSTSVVAIDTAGPVIGVAVRRGDEIRARRSRIDRGAEQVIVPWIGELCAEIRIEIADLGGVAVAVGPGRFTGIRVGIATATGLAQALGVPVWPGPSLDHRAWAVDAPRVLAQLDARKGRVYAAAYESGRLVRGPADVPPEEARSWMREPFVTTDPDDPAIEVLARLAADGLAKGGGVAATAVVPVYLREADVLPLRG
jgi:tRNA threonylcarbamoyladenosine biosynthesis protein TsaB